MCLAQNTNWGQENVYFEERGHGKIWSRQRKPLGARGRTSNNANCLTSTVHLHATWQLVCQPFRAETDRQTD